MIFLSERNVRDWLRRNLPNRVWWVEHGRGGSFGLPDAIVADSCGAAFVELKLAHKAKDKGWTFGAAPTQILTLQKMRAAGLRAMLAAGISGTGMIGILWKLDKIERFGQDEMICRAKYVVKSWDYLFEEQGGWPNGVG